MDSRLSGTQSLDDFLGGSIGKDDTASSTYRSMNELFEEHCPYYLSIGMTPDEYWHGPPELVKYYREAAELKLEKRNQELWLQGFYVYQALADVSPLFRFSMKGGEIKAHEYLSEPIPITKKAKEEQKVQAERERQENIRRAMMERVNIAKQAKENKENGSTRPGSVTDKHRK